MEFSDKQLLTIKKALCCYKEKLENTGVDAETMAYLDRDGRISYICNSKGNLYEKKEINTLIDTINAKLLEE